MWTILCWRFSGAGFCFPTSPNSCRRRFLSLSGAGPSQANYRPKSFHMNLPSLVSSSAAAGLAAGLSHSIESLRPLPNWKGENTNRAKAQTLQRHFRDFDEEQQSPNDGTDFASQIIVKYINKHLSFGMESQKPKQSQLETSFGPKNVSCLRSYKRLNKGKCFVHK